MAEQPEGWTRVVRSEEAALWRGVAAELVRAATRSPGNARLLRAMARVLRRAVAP
jgi:hypothetical protein